MKMKVKEVVEQLSLTLLTWTPEGLEQEVSGGYVSDLLSNVMGQAKGGNLWVTMQGHVNIVAVASLAGVSAVIVAGGAAVDEKAMEKARENNIVLLTSPRGAFEIVGQMYQLGIGAGG